MVKWNADSNTSEEKGKNKWQKSENINITL